MSSCATYSIRRNCLDSAIFDSLGHAKNAISGKSEQFSINEDEDDKITLVGDLIPFCGGKVGVEAHENVFALDQFDSDAVAAMICWVYNGQYGFPIPENRSIYDEGEICFLDITKSQLYLHANVLRLGDYLDMPGVTNHANQQLREVFFDYADYVPQIFSTYARFAFDEGPEILQKAVVEAAYRHMEDLINRPDFKDLNIPAFHNQLLKHIWDHGLKRRTI
ncbi:hypothetical protein KEM56_006786 [Ascosphaera pollenicola]|nr:hypothetical protein KEM56_006786 [Ascosphaera pollenicola]